MRAPTVREIVTAYLEEHGYDGLVNHSMECACLTAELPACDDVSAHCEAGHKVAGCEPDCLIGGCEWHMRPGPRPTPTTRSE